MATIKDIARLSNVSIATVSRVINQSPNVSQTAIKNVSQAMKALNYRPNAVARALVCQTSNTLGVLVGNVSDPFFGSLVNTVGVAAKAKNMHLLIGNGYHDPVTEKQAIEKLLDSRCDAMIVHAKGLSDEALIEYANEIKGMVIINRRIEKMAHRCVYLDNQKGAFLATLHLIEQGHKEIACIASCMPIEDTKARIQGYLDALKSHQLPIKKEYIFYGEPNSLGGEAAMNIIFKQLPRITAVVCYNDYMAAGVIDSCEKHQKSIPKALSLVGFDDGLVAQFLRPRLTTIHYPIEAMTQNAVELATSLAFGRETKPLRNAFVPDLIKRDTVSILSHETINA